MTRYSVFVLAVATVATSCVTARPVERVWGEDHWMTGEVVEVAGETSRATYRVLRADPSPGGWEKIEVTGSGFQIFDDQGEATGEVGSFPPVILLVLRGERGIEGAYRAGRLPEWAFAELVSEHRSRLAECEGATAVHCPPDERQVYVVSMAALLRIAARRGSGLETPDLPTGEPEEPVRSHLRIGLPSCGDFDKSFRLPLPSATWTPEPAMDVKTSSFDGRVGSSLRFSLNDDGESHDSRVTLRFKRSPFSLCIPWMVYLHEVILDLQAGIGAELWLTGQVSHGGGGTSREVQSIPLGAIAFVVGPIPVVLPFDVPIAVGVDSKVDTAGSVEYRAAASGAFSRRYVCGLTGCEAEDGGSGFEFTRRETWRLEDGRATLFVFVEAGARVALYDKRVAQVGAGARPGVVAEAVYRSPARGCGDADGIAPEEIVEGRLLDLDGKVELFTRAGVATQTWEKFATLPKTHFDLLEGGLRPGSVSIFTPIFEALGAQSHPDGYDLFGPPENSLRYAARMRPCWPWNDWVTYRLVAQDADPPEQEARSEHAEKQSTAHDFIFRSLRPPKDNRAVFVRDGHGRAVAGHETHRVAMGRLPPVGFLDHPSADEIPVVPLGGKLAVFGWAADPDGSPGAPVRQVTVTVGGRPVATATAAIGGLPYERPDVVAAHGGRRDYLWSGWSTVATLYDAPLGVQELAATAWDAEDLDGVLTGGQRVEVVANDTIETAGTVEETDDNAVFRGDTGVSTATLGIVYYHDDYQASCGAGARGRDAVYRLVLTRPRTVVLSTGGSSFETVLHVKRWDLGSLAPGGPRGGRGSNPLDLPLEDQPVRLGGLVEVACDDGSTGTGQGELTLHLSAGTYFVIVDGAYPDRKGRYALLTMFR